MTWFVRCFVRCLACAILICLAIAASSPSAPMMAFYDKNWQLQYYLVDDEIYDKNWIRQYYLRGDRVYDKDWQLQYYLKDGELFDKNWQRQYYLRERDTTKP